MEAHEGIKVETPISTLVLFGAYLGALQGFGSAAQHARLHPDVSSYLALVPASLLFGHYPGLPALVVVGLTNMLCDAATVARRLGFVQE